MYFFLGKIKKHLRDSAETVTSIKCKPAKNKSK